MDVDQYLTDVDPNGFVVGQQALIGAQTRGH